MNELKNKQQVHNDEDAQTKSRVANGWRLMALGGFIGFLGGVFTMLDFIPEMRDLFLYGLTSIGVTVAIYGTYLVLER